MGDKPAGGIKKIQATGLMRKLMGAYFQELDRAARTGDRKIAWCTSVGPAELLRSFGFLVYFPENHGAVLGSSRMAADLIPAANARGYSPDICSYLTSDVGSYLKRQTPLIEAFGMAGLPQADILVYNTNQCRDVQDWFAFYRREWDVPLIGIDTQRGLGEITRDHLDGLIAQHKALIPTLEEISGRAFDLDRLKEVVASSYRCTRLWKKVLRLAVHRPSPITFFDGTIHMGPAVVLRGTAEAEQYYEVLVAELEQRIAAGVAAVDGERHRYYWEGMPVWGKLRDHAELFSAQRACVVASTYCNSWIFEPLDCADPFEGMARAYTELFIVRSEDFKERYLKTMFETYGIDGIIYHDAKTCPNNSNCRYGMPQRLTGETGVPYVTINGDLNDLRLYSEEQVRTQFEALAEQLQEGA
ncbi:2-hydroxyacyl-CoA dehydratase family protein [bacterium]|nr:2-hydroxyacyl-CoA dehydratase family protein [bacterium]MBU1675163.1 2-hydroxyacyl-CoA dehydratase family protein [bacterium]